MVPDGNQKMNGPVWHVNTPNGLDILYATVGIRYQNSASHQEDDDLQLSDLRIRQRFEDREKEVP